MKKMFRLLWLLAIVGVLAACCNKSGKYESVPGDPLNARIYTLDNGLKVYMTQNPEQPRLQTYIAVQVGAKNDPKETTGLAHYFEHLMFKGTEQFGTQNYAIEKPLLDEIEALFEIYRKTTDEAERAALYHRIDSISYEASKYAIPNEYDKLMSAIGATGTNAYTTYDETVFQEDIPSNEIENWAKVQSDRFKNAVIRGFHTELETVYEEKNMSLTKDNRKVYEQILTALFPNHPYGTQTVLGTQHNLKNPSITNIKNFFKQWYVPNNMAICISGDFNPDSVLMVINKYFGDMQPKDSLPRLQVVPEAPITAPIEREVLGLDAANVTLGWRFAGAASPDMDILNMIGQVMCNGQAGMVDLDINQQQRMLGAYAGAMGMADYSMFLMVGQPKEGQTLEEAKAILLEEIEKLKKGEFDEMLLQAAVNNYKRDIQKGLESNENRAKMFVDAFIQGADWKDKVASLNNMGKITKQQIVDFANDNFKDNYVVVYKRQGQDPNEVKMTKPVITPLAMNRDTASQFLTDIKLSNVNPIEPVFIDYDKDMEQEVAKAGIPVLYKKNTTNDLFTLTFVFDKGSNEDKVLPIAAEYMNYLGTAEMHPMQVKLQSYVLATEGNLSVGKDKTYVQISGLSENMVPALQLFESLLAGGQTDPQVLENMKADILTGRQNAKLNQDVNFRMLGQYAMYGPKSPATNILSAQELAQLQPEDLLSRLRELNSYEHKILYYGPKSKEAVIADIEKYHNVPDKLIPVEKNDSYKALETPTNRVLIAPYDAKQVYMAAYSNRGEKYDKNLEPVVTLYNEYFGGGMNAIVFQEMRESRGLAYTAMAQLNVPSRLDRPYTYGSFIATQNDKVMDALSAFKEIINNMPESENAFNLAKEGLLTRLRTDRTTGEGVLGSYLQAQDLGLTEDLRRQLFNDAQNLTLENIKEFQQKWVKDRTYTYYILGNEKDLDMNKLSAYGPITRVKTEEIFGY